MAIPPVYTTNPQGGIMQQVVTTQPGAVVVGSPEQPPRGNWKGQTVTGIIQVVLGILTAILGIVTASAIKIRYYTDIGTPIWCGLLFYCIAGTLGILAGVRKNTCLSIAYMVMSILACLSSCSVITAAGVGMDSCTRSYDSTRYDGYRYYYDRYNGCDIVGLGMGVYSVLIILALAEFVVSIVGASLTCTGVCCATPVQHTVIHYQPQPFAVTSGQPMQGVVAVNAPPAQQQWGAYPYPPQQQEQAQPIPEKVV